MSDKYEFEHQMFLKDEQERKEKEKEEEYSDGWARMVFTLFFVAIFGWVFFWPSDKHENSLDKHENYPKSVEPSVTKEYVTPRVNIGDGVVLERGAVISQNLQANNYLYLKAFVRTIRNTGYICNEVTRAYWAGRVRMRCDHGMNRFYFHYRGGRYFLEAY